MAHPRDYWLALAVYDDFRGVPVRKVIARGYVDLRSMAPERQDSFIRLGSLFFQGRCRRKYVGDGTPAALDRLTPEERAELDLLRTLRRAIGAAFVKMLDDDQALSATARDVTLERLETMGFIGEESPR
jgi:hypothetical protein